ncbi:MAG: Protein-disulfide isomerase [Parcubacteria group bacterium GW2011_GWC1_45_9]|nr:MAG: Protein-disulfide isomerase [Parcubacteria group bacterium GW2011_GWA1_Parcubacteria_45_10]KKT89294.1 MAG: Protein-disulfide isomerase [Parcubacteria group bacterium GW2011_GWB1_45_10]KKU17208.1 MAG: Protein-disulfide isomerase [Parcubacteria group bacterium GW2011_GWC1_45_9]
MIFGGATALLGAIFFLMYSLVWQGAGASVFDIQLNDSDWKRGNPGAKVTLVEYSDFQCPACAVYYPVVEKIVQDYSDKILFVYRQFPLTRIHKNANLAAFAGEAAGRQNQFWQMSEKLFENQEIWSNANSAKEIFLGYAKELKLDEAEFLRDLESEAVKEKVFQDYQSGLKFQVDGTPSFFINGKRIQNPAGYESFKSIIEAELK